MASGRALAGCDRGGAGISPSRPSGTRVATSAGAAAALGVVVLRTALAGGTVGSAGAVIAALGIPPLLVSVLLRFTPVIPWAVGLTGAGYVVGRAHHTTVDGWAAVVGALLLVAAELAWWAADEDRRIHTERAVVVRRVALLAGLAGIAALTGLVLVGAAAVSTPAGTTLSVVGMAAAIGAVGVVLRLLHGAPRRSRDDEG